MRSLPFTIATLLACAHELPHKGPHTAPASSPAPHATAPSDGPHVTGIQVSVHLGDDMTTTVGTQNGAAPQLTWSDGSVTTTCPDWYMGDAAGLRSTLLGTFGDATGSFIYFTPLVPGTMMVCCAAGEDVVESCVSLTVRPRPSECLSQIRVQPYSADVRAGESFSFTAEFCTEEAAPCTTRRCPRWSIKGDLGTVAENGTFTAKANGRGTGEVCCSADDVEGCALLRVAPDIRTQRMDFD